MSERRVARSVSCLALGRDNKEQVVARARSYNRHPCHVGISMGLKGNGVMKEGRREEEKDGRRMCYKKLLC